MCDFDITVVIPKMSLKTGLSTGVLSLGWSMDVNRGIFNGFMLNVEGGRILFFHFHAKFECKLKKSYLMSPKNSIFNVKTIEYSVTFSLVSFVFEHVSFKS